MGTKITLILRFEISSADGLGRDRDLTASGKRRPKAVIQRAGPVPLLERHGF